MRTLLSLKLFIIVSLLMSSYSASSTLIERDYLSENDGGITYDSESGYEWLDLSFTRSMCLTASAGNDCHNYNEYLSNLDDGWIFASSQLVSDLLINFSFTSGKSDIYGEVKSGSGYYYYNDPKPTFIDHVNELTILGETMSQGSSLYGIKGFTSDNVNGAHEQFMAYYNNSQSLGIVAFADYHRVPQGKPIQSFFTYRKARAEVRFEPVIQVPEPATLGIFTLMLFIILLRRYQTKGNK